MKMLRIYVPNGDAGVLLKGVSCWTHSWHTKQTEKLSLLPGTRRVESINRWSVKSVKACKARALRSELTGSVRDSERSINNNNENGYRNIVNAAFDPVNGYAHNPLSATRCLQLCNSNDRCVGMIHDNNNDCTIVFPKDTANKTDVKVTYVRGAKYRFLKTKYSTHRQVTHA